MKYNTREEIRDNLRIGDYLLISELTKGLYRPETVKAQILGWRTLKEPVIDAANKLFESREALLSA